ncbi:8-oxo-dGTP diphosphatase [Haloarchaeobius sp. HRN-SO-5]|uniref:8-oxo-dGTP diphosphatase n=1 Tax=Haloarchaeobius sp. HRN-SO-5 TaxID=3446118 RepID=UPI003EBF92C9
MAEAGPTDESTADRDEATICYPVRGDLPLSPDDELLMIRKRRGLGSDLYNGPGGKVEADESPLEAAVRETREEVGLDVGDLTKRAEFDFFFGDEHVFLCHVYVAREVAGTARTTEEAIPEWRTRESIPYDEMWEDDELWLPAVLDGDTVCGTFYFDDDGDELVDHDVALGVSFDGSG